MRRLVDIIAEALDNDAALVLVSFLGLLTITLSVLTLSVN